MRSLHKIIHNRETGNDNLHSRYNLHLKYNFIEQKSSAESSPKQNTDPSELLAEAQRQAEAVMEKARHEAVVEAEHIKANAVREGYDEGYQSALEAAHAEAEKIRAEARAVLARAEEVRRRQLAGLKGNILELALEIAEKILARELELNPDAAVAIAEEAIQIASNRKYVVLWVHPEEVELYEKHRERLVRHLPPHSELQIMEDPTVERSGCVAENEFGRVDAQLSNRWQNLCSIIKEEID